MIQFALKSHLDIEILITFQHNPFCLSSIQKLIDSLRQGIDIWTYSRLTSVGAVYIVRPSIIIFWAGLLFLEEFKKFRESKILDDFRWNVYIIGHK